MARLFICHSSHDNIVAVAFKKWLTANGWSDEDVFLDLDDLSAGERWKEALYKANARCEAVILLASSMSLTSHECLAEVRQAEGFGKEIVVVLLADVHVDDSRLGSYKDRQFVELAAVPQAHLETVSYRGQNYDVRFNETALIKIKDYLVRRGIAPEHFAWPPKDQPDAEPFPGLSAFPEEYAGVFFGRDADIIRGLDKIRIVRRNRRPRVLVISAASGAGKSSFLRAGLWPRLKRDPDFAPIGILRPSQGLLTGPEGFGRKIAPLLSRPGEFVAAGDLNAAIGDTNFDNAKAALRSVLEQAARITAEQRATTADRAAPPALLLAIDQAEELFSTAHAPENNRFLRLLADVLREPPPGVELFIFLTIRADSTGRLLDALAANDIEMPETLLLPPLPITSFRDVILKPIEVMSRAGRKIAIAPDLADRLVREATGADALPLLAFTLSRLFHDYNSVGVLTLDQYEKMGGVGGSIDRALKDALMKSGTVGSESNLRRLIIPHLASWDPDTDSPKRMVAQGSVLTAGDRAELAPLADALVEVRLLTRSVVDGAPTLEVAHEALLRREPVQSWLRADQDFLVFKAEAERGQARWAGRKESDELLLTGFDLARAEEYVARRPEDLSATVVRFLQRSSLVDRARKDRRLKVQRYLTAAAVVAALTTAGFGGFAWMQRDSALRERDKANVAEERASAEKDRADVALQSALKTQSNFLVDLSRQEREKGDIATSMLLAIEALPDETSSDPVRRNRPRIQAAQIGLSTSLATNREAALLSGHANEVHRVAYSSDGKRLLSVARADKPPVRLWDAESGRFERGLDGHSDEVISARFSGDGARVATASADATAIIWETATGVRQATLRGHTARIMNAVFNPAGTRVLTVSEDGTARLWNATDGTLIRKLEHPAPLYDGLFAMDGSRVVTAARDSAARIWDAETGAMLAEISAQEPTDKLRVEDPILSSVNKATWSILQRIGIGPPLRVSEDGRLCAIFGSDSSAKIFRIDSGEIVSSLKAVSSRDRIIQAIVDAHFNPDGVSLAALSWPAGNLSAWELTTGKLTSEKIGEGSWQFAYRLGGQQIATLVKTHLSLFETSTGKVVKNFVGHQSGVLSLAISPDQRRIATGSGDNTIRLWNTDNPHTAAHVSGWARANDRRRFEDDVDQSDANRKAGAKHDVVVVPDAALRLVDTTTGRELATFDDAKGLPVDAFFTEDGKRVFAKFESKSKNRLGEEVEWRVWNVESKALVATFDAYQKIAIDRTGRLLLGAKSSARPVVIDVDTQSTRTVLETDRPSYSIDNPALSGSGRLAAIRNGDEVNIWQVDDGKMIASLKDVDYGVDNISFTPDEKFLVAQRTLDSPTLWDIESGKRVDPRSPLSGVSGFTTLSMKGRLGAATQRGGRWIVTHQTGNSVVLEGLIGKIREHAINNDGKRVAVVRDSASAGRTAEPKTNRSLEQLLERFEESDKRVVDLWDAETGKKVANIVDNEPATNVSFSEDGALLIVDQAGGTTKVWNARTAAPLSTLKETDKTFRTTWSASRDSMFLSDGNSVWAVGTGEIVVNDLDNASIAFSPDGKLVAAVNRLGLVTLHGLAEARVSTPLQLRGIADVDRVQFDKRGGRLLVASSRALAVIEVDANQLVGQLELATILSRSDASRMTVNIADDGKEVVVNASRGDGTSVTKRWNPLNNQLVDAAHPMAEPNSSSASKLTDDSRDFWTFDATTGEPLQVFSGHERLVTSLAFSGNGRRIASTSEDGTVRIWDVKTGWQVATINDADGADGVQFSSAGDRLLTRNFGEHRLWDPETGKLLVSMQADAISQARFSPNGERIIAGGKIWDARTGLLISTVAPAAGLPLLAVDANGARAVIARSDRHGLEVGTFGSQRRVIAHHTHPIKSVEEGSPEGILLTVTTDDVARAWDKTTGRLLSSIGGDAYPIGSVSIAPDGRLAAVVPHADARHLVKLWDFHADRVVAEVPQSDEAALVEFSPDGRAIAIVRRTLPSLQLWRLDGLAKLAMLDTDYENSRRPFEFSADGRWLLGIGREQADIVNLESGETISTIKFDKTSAARVSFTDDSASVAVEEEGGVVSLWDLKGKRLAQLARPSSCQLDPKGSGTCEATGKRKITFSRGEAKVVDPSSTRDVFEIKWTDAAIAGAFMSLDGQLVALYTKSSLRVQNVGLARDVLLTNAVSDVAGGSFNSNGTRMLTVHTDGSVWDWDLKSGEAIARMVLDDSKIASAAYTHDDADVYSLSNDGSLARWPVYRALQNVVDAAKRHVPRCLTRAERERFFLGAEPPDWCIDASAGRAPAGAKWPYEEKAWSDWLDARRRGESVELPKIQPTSR